MAWQVWMHFHTDRHLGAPFAFEHQCGSLGKITEDYSDISCPGCRFEVARPETECSPLYVNSSTASPTI